MIWDRNAFHCMSINMASNKMTNRHIKKTGAAGLFDQKENFGKFAAHGNPLKRLNEFI